MGQFLTDLVVKQSAKDDSDDVDQGRGVWTLVEPLRYSANSGQIFEVPAGFKTDFASVPRILLIFDAFGDRANLAATLHDWLYAKNPTTGEHPVPSRDVADSLIREAALAQGCDQVVADVLYAGVRAGGASHWD